MLLRKSIDVGAVWNRLPNLKIFVLGLNQIIDAFVIQLFTKIELLEKILKNLLRDTTQWFCIFVLGFAQ